MVQAMADFVSAIVPARKVYGPVPKTNGVRHVGDHTSDPFVIVHTKPESHAERMGRKMAQRQLRTRAHLNGGS